MIKPTDTDAQARALSILIGVNVDNAKKYVVALRNKYGHGFGVRWLILLAIKDAIGGNDK